MKKYICNQGEFHEAKPYKSICVFLSNTPIDENNLHKLMPWYCDNIQDVVDYLNKEAGDLSKYKYILVKEFEFVGNV